MPAPRHGLKYALKSRLKHTAAWLRQSLLEPAAFGSRLSKCDPVLIFQMGKVASTSVYYSLKDIYPGAVVHTHWLKPDHLDWKVRRFYKEVFQARRPFRVVSLTREPLGRNLSAFFQNYEELTGTARGKVAFSVEELTDFFLEKYHHDFPLNWFEENIERHFGIDVFADRFPGRGFHEYRNGNVRLLVMRSELNDEKKGKVLREFLDIPKLIVQPRNISTRKGYGNQYGEFKSQIKLPVDYIDRMCASRYFRHFYDEETIEQVRAQWLRRLENPV